MMSLEEMIDELQKRSENEKVSITGAILGMRAAYSLGRENGLKELGQALGIETKEET